MSNKKRLKKIEKHIKKLDVCVATHGKRIFTLQREVNGNGFPFMRLSFGDGGPTKTRIDCALDQVSSVQRQLNSLCKNLGLKIRGKDEMPDFEVLKDSKKKTK